MKKIFTFFFVMFTLASVYAQNVGIGTASPNASAALDISNTAKGLLIPRMTSNGITTIVSPAKGLMVYDSVKNQLMVNMGTASIPNWQTIVASSEWTLSGNGGTDISNNFIGTTDAVPLLFKVNNLRAAYLDPNTKNTSFGVQALNSNSSGSSNTATGALALFSNTVGGENTAEGVSSLYSNISGSANTASGYNSLYANTTGQSNTAMGIQALANNTTASINTAIGAYAMQYNTIGSYNTAIGSGALTRTTQSYYNTAVGYQAGSMYDLGYNNTFIGAGCDGAFPGVYNDIAIGLGVTCTDNSQARIGNSATYSIGGYADWTNISDGRYKKNVKENVQGLAFIMKLRPVTYNLDITGLSNKLNESRGKEPDAFMKKAIADKEQVVQTGFVAQEVEQAAKEVGYDFSGVDKPRTPQGFYGLRYAQFVVPLVKAVQEQQQMIEAFKKDNHNQEVANAQMQKEIDDLKAMIKK